MFSNTDMSDKIENKCVILLHGLFRHSTSMTTIEKALRKAGYLTLNFDYNSTISSVAAVSEMLDLTIKNKIPPEITSISFVTHSMGAVVVRYYLHFYPVKRLSRFVMIAPPNKGSSLGTFLSQFPLFDMIAGKAGREITDSPDSLVSVLPERINCDFGIIAGGLGIEIGINPLLQGDNDGTITVSETCLDGANDFIVLRGQHSTLIIQDNVIKHIIFFLKTGSFLKD